MITGADVNDEYQAILQSALLRLEPRTIVDMSQIPVLSKTEFAKLNYVTVYDDEFLRAFEQYNKHITQQLPLLLSDIEEILRAAQIYLSAKAA